MPPHVPDDPDTYFRAFFPEQFRASRTHFPAGDAAAATRFRILDVGSWSMVVRDDALVVGDVEDADVALELATTLDDFRALFVAYPRAEIARTGGLTDGARAALRPLVLTDHKRAVCQRSRRTLALDLKHARQVRRILVTPGGGEATEPASTVRLSFEDYLAIQMGKRGVPRLFLTRRLKVKGALTHAARLEPLLG